MLTTVSSVLARMIDSYTGNIHSIVNRMLGIFVIISFSGFQANILQLGIDQLHDASTNEIILFILWYVWTYYSSGFVIDFILGCLPSKYQLLGNLVMCIYVSLAISSMLMFNHWLVKEPVTQNPFKLFYSVIRYAIKHKHPECRSAFTYGEDEPPSRTDFGKSKYGGPFTTEQVEDVKTFLRVLIVTLVGIITFVVMIATRQLTLNLSDKLTDISNARDELFSKCYSKDAFVEVYFYSGVILLPLYELFFYSVFYRCLEVIKSGWKFILDTILLLAEILSVLVIDTVARYKYLDSANYNTTIPCIGKGTLSAIVDYWWMAMLMLLHSLSTNLLGIGAVKFIASQAPYSMRGLIMGTAYCIFVLYIAVGVGTSILFTKRPSI